MKVGSLVECIYEPTNDRLDLGGPSFVRPIRGNIYVIDEIKHYVGIVWVSLNELPELDELGERHYYSIDCFRELQPPMSIADELFSHAPETCEA